MYKYLVVLKGNNKDLARFEFMSLWSVYFNENIELKRVQNVVYEFFSSNVLEKNCEMLKRLTYTNVLSLCLCEADGYSDFESKVKSIDFSKLNGKTFLLRIKKSKHTFKVNLSERDLAKPIWNSLKDPKVSMTNPDFIFHCFFFEKKNGFVFCENLFENDKGYLRRMPKLRPVKMPYTLKSDMARASVNLLGLKEGTILDPFCGIGGILLEAYDMGFKIIGNDISYNDLKYFKDNFDYFFPKSDSRMLRTLADSKTQFLKENSVDGIVTDIPYGKCSRKLGVDLYEGFLKSAKTYLKKGKRMVVIYANFVEFKEIAIKYFDEVCEMDEYINKSMRRYILVLEKK